MTQLATIEHSSLKWKSIVDMNNEEIKNYELLRYCIINKIYLDSYTYLIYLLK